MAHDRGKGDDAAAKITCSINTKGGGGVLPRLKLARDLLRSTGVWQLISPWNPVIAGSIPLGIDTVASDIDVLCEVPNLDAFVLRAVQLVRFPGCSLHREQDADPPAIVCRLAVEGRSVELFAQSTPVTEQRAYRHMIAEKRLLDAAGSDAATEIRRLKMLGIKTEPAFTELFALAGDPYLTLLEVPDWSDNQVTDTVRRARRVRSECPFCLTVDADSDVTVY